MLPSEAASQEAATALVAEGFSQEDLVLASGEQLLENERLVDDQRSLVARFLGLFPGEETGIIERYRELASQGHAVIAVRVPEPAIEQRRHVAALLRQHGGAEVHYYGKRTIDNL